MWSAQRGFSQHDRLGEGFRRGALVMTGDGVWYRTVWGDVICFLHPTLGFSNSFGLRYALLQQVVLLLSRQILHVLPGTQCSTVFLESWRSGFPFLFLSAFPSFQLLRGNFTGCNPLHGMVIARKGERWIRRTAMQVALKSHEKGGVRREREGESMGGWDLSFTYISSCINCFVIVLLFSIHSTSAEHPVEA